MILLQEMHLLKYTTVVLRSTAMPARYKLSVLIAVQAYCAHTLALTGIPAFVLRSYSVCACAGLEWGPGHCGMCELIAPGCEPQQAR